MEKWQKFTEEQLKEIFENSNSYKEISEKLGYSYGGNILKKIKKIALEKNFNLSLKTKDLKQQNKEKEDMLGQIFGRLTVLSKDEERTKETKRTYFKCQCNCENKTIISIRYDALIDKNRPTLSCGCLQKEAAQKQGIDNRHNLIGLQYGELTVIKHDIEQSKIHNRPYWICKCSCGTQLSISATALRSGQKSCGHIKSNGEYQIQQILNSLSYNFEQQKTFPDLLGDVNTLKLDFFLPDKNIAIECQGQQHYYAMERFGGEEQLKKQQRYDQIKRDYCKSHNIKLIEIPYWHYKNINKEYVQSLLS